jgi:hypothetical protein
LPGLQAQETQSKKNVISFPVCMPSFSTFCLPMKNGRTSGQHRADTSAAAYRPWCCVETDGVMIVMPEGG